MVFSVFSVFFGFFSVFSVFFSVFRVCLETVCCGVAVVSLLYQNREFRLIRNKHRTHPNSLKESIFGYFSENLGLFRFVSVCYETILFVIGFTKQTETNAKQILFRFVSVRTENYFCLFRRHPN